MTVGRDYLLNKPRRPSGVRSFLHTRIVPLAVNAAGTLEAALERVSVRTGVRPAALLAASTGVLTLTLFYLARRRAASRT